MKKLLFIIAAVLLFSCSKEKDVDTQSDIGTMELTVSGKTYLFKVTDKDQQGINMLYTYGYYTLSAVDRLELKKSFVLSGLSTSKMKGVLLDHSSTSVVNNTVVSNEEEDLIMSMTENNGRVSGTISGKVISARFTNVTYVKQ